MDDAQIQAVIDRVMVELDQGDRVRHGPTPSPPEVVEPPRPTPSPRHADNLFEDVGGAVGAAHVAYRELLSLPLALRERMITQIRRAVREHAQQLAYEAWRETGMGRYEDKIEKVLLNANKAPGTELLATGAWSGDGGLTVVEYAPYGVIGSIIPSTNPISTVVCNAISMVAAGNAVVFNAHPAAAACSNRTVQLVNDAIVEAGGPANLVSAIAEPTIDTAQQLMTHQGVNLLTVTGGAGVVQAAMASGIEPTLSDEGP
jgi:acyl-CoA reductase-like NAD-dependent aldehyde dehydrogenase